MTFTVAGVENRVQRRFPDFVDATADEYINLVHQELLWELPLITTSEDISLTAGTQEYAVNAECIRIISAELVSSATVRTPIEIVRKEYLDQVQPGWRSITRGTPSRMYLTRSTTAYTVGLLPIPVTTTSGGYPVLRLHESRTDELSTGDNLPQGLMTPDVYVYGALYRFALDNRATDDEVAMFKKMFEESKQKERKRHESMSPAPVTVMMRGLGMGGVTR